MNLVTLFRLVSALCLVLSLAVGGVLILWDTVHGFVPMLIHQRSVAVALMLIGASYAAAHATGPLRSGARVRAVSLGLAFVLWGAEQFMPMSRVVVGVDCVLVCVFVVDLSLSVVNRLKNESGGGE